MKKLNNKIALITGGTKGIGFAIAEEMLKEGMKIVITGRNEKGVEEAKNKLSTSHHADNIVGSVSDVRDTASLQKCVHDAQNHFGNPLDIVIANAGIGHFAPISEMSHEKWNEIIDVNLTGVFNTVKATLETLKLSKGYFITIGSIAGANFFEMGTAYNASKFGLLGFSQALMLDLRKVKIKVSTIMPGSVTTYFNGHTPNKQDDWKISPEDIGQIVIDLLKMPERTLPSKIEVRPSFPINKYE